MISAYITTWGHKSVIVFWWFLHFRFVVLCQKHLWDSPGFTHPKATSPCGISGAIGDITMGQILKWGFSWRSATWRTWRTRWGGETKRFCVKAWCLELINVYKSGKFLMIFYDILSYTVYIYIYTHHIYIYIFFGCWTAEASGTPFFVWRSFLCLNEALTEAIYSFGGDVGRSGNPGTTWRVYTWENTRPSKLSHNELENGCFNVALYWKPSFDVLLWLLKVHNLLHVDLS